MFSFDPRCQGGPTRLLLRVERTCRSSWPTSEFDPKQTSSLPRLGTAKPGTETVLFGTIYNQPEPNRG